MGSCGAPNDGGIHQNFHFIRQGYQRAALGWNRNALLAKSSENYEVTNSGDVKLQIALPISLESDVYALQCIKEYKQGKLALWAWSSRGYSTVKDIARWHFNGDEEAALALMAPTKTKEFTEYVQLRQLPTLRLLGEHAPRVAVAELPSSFLKGEKVHVWFADRGAEGMIPLPHWCSLPIECALSQWKHEEKSWNQKITERFPKPLAPNQQKQYDTWVENSTRRIVLDQESRAVVKHPGSCPKGHLAKHGVLLETFWNWRIFHNFVCLEKAVYISILHALLSTDQITYSF